MGVYIKGIEIPNDNFVTVVAIYRNPKTERIYAEWTDELGIHHGIKLVEISTPHGWLIDELKRHRNEYANDHGWNTSVLEALDTAIKTLEVEE